MNTSNSPKTHKVAFCTYPKCQTTGMKCTGQCSQANCHVQSVPDGWQLVPTQRLKNARNLVDRGLWVEGAKVLDDLIASAPPAPQAEQHSDDAVVDRFAAALKDKLATSRQKGRGGWETCSAEDLGRMLREHVEKGDPRDVANFCMFLWSLGHGIAPKASAVQQEPSQAASDAYDRIDHLLRRRLDDHDYTHYSFDLDLVWGAGAAQQAKPHPLSDVRDAQAMYKHPDLPTLREVFKDGWNCAEAARGIKE